MNTALKYISDNEAIDAYHIRRDTLLLEYDPKELGLSELVSLIENELVMCTDDDELAEYIESLFNELRIRVGAKKAVEEKLNPLFRLSQVHSLLEYRGYTYGWDDLDEEYEEE